MKIVFRWYGENDSIPLKYIKQIPKVEGIVTALYSIPIGEIWPLERLIEVKNEIESAGLKFSVIESIPVHEDIKLGKEETRDKLIENYCKSIENMGKLNIEVLTYNFMPIFDWTRTDLASQNPDGSKSLSYEQRQLEKIDLSKGTYDLPGWGTTYSKEELKVLLDFYSNINEDKLWENLEYFLKRVVPVAEEYEVKMGIHPDDPPWSIFNLPRIITNEKALDRVVNIIDSPSNGITFCTGSFGPNMNMDLIKSIRKFGSQRKIPFLHFRNIKRMNEHSFKEVAHPTEYGDVDMYKVIKTLVDVNFEGFIRPDHGRIIWGEKGKPGYGLYDRALGITYLAGLWEGINKTLNLDKKMKVE
ncbi:MAG: mannonate dehydratase [Promethearchaeota archaeon]|nr:MAG: mannonate dehydratase [Candidatus Lokiarchaeota archaeon]